MLSESLHRDIEGSCNNTAYMVVRFYFACSLFDVVNHAINNLTEVEGKS